MRRLGWLLLALLLVGWLLTGVKEVRPGEVAVVRRFGRVLDVRPRAGLWIGLPWGLDRVDRVPIEKVRSVTVGYSPLEASDDTPAGQLLTGDRNLINVRVVVNWAIDPEALLAYVEQQERAEELIVRAAETTLTEWMGGRTVDEVLLRGKTRLPVELPRLLQQRLELARLGVRVRGVDVAYLAAPDDVKDAFERVNLAEAYARKGGRAEQEAREETHRKEAESAAVIRKLDAEGEAYAVSRPRDARAEALAFEARLEALQANPLAREAGRWMHLVQLVRRLAATGNLQPLDPALESPLPGPR